MARPNRQGLLRRGQGKNASQWRLQSHRLGFDLDDVATFGLALVCLYNADHLGFDAKRDDADCEVIERHLNGQATEEDKLLVARALREKMK